MDTMSVFVMLLACIGVNYPHSILRDYPAGKVQCFLPRALHGGAHVQVVSTSTIIRQRGNQTDGSGNRDNWELKLLLIKYQQDEIASSESRLSGISTSYDFSDENHQAAVWYGITDSSFHSHSPWNNVVVFYPKRQIPNLFK